MCCVLCYSDTEITMDDEDKKEMPVKLNKAMELRREQQVKTRARLDAAAKKSTTTKKATYVSKKSLHKT